MGQILAMTFKSQGCGVLRTWTSEFTFYMINNTFGGIEEEPGFLTSRPRGEGNWRDMIKDKGLWGSGWENQA